MSSSHSFCPERRQASFVFLQLIAFPPNNITSGSKMFIGSFEGNFSQFQFDVDAAVQQFTASGVTNLIIDVTNNGGSFVFAIRYWKV